MGFVSFRGKDIISILDFSKSDLETLFERAYSIERSKTRGLNVLRGRIMALAFFEPSTRTRLSFTTAMKRLGGDVIGFSSVEATSVMKGENLTDTIRMLDAYSDIIVLRHNLEGAARYAAEIAENPVVNAGDGRCEHPTQSMLDLYTIYRLFGDIDGLNIGIMGDLKYARTVASLSYALTLFKPNKVYYIAPPPLKLREEVLKAIEKRGLKYEEYDNIEDVISLLDVLYVVRIQKERFPDPMEYERVKGAYRITLEFLEKNARKNLKILHPLPKVDEIHPKVDKSPYQAYFYQAKLGVPVRMALLTLIFGVEV